MTHPSKIKKGLNIPWGYRANEDDPKLLDPIDEMLDALGEAKEHVKNDCSYRSVAAWLSDRTGVRISHVALFEKIRQERHAELSAIGKKQWEKRFGTKEHSPASIEEAAT